MERAERATQQARGPAQGTVTVMTAVYPAVSDPAVVRPAVYG